MIKYFDKKIRGFSKLANFKNSLGQLYFKFIKLTKYFKDSKEIYMTHITNKFPVKYFDGKYI